MENLNGRQNIYNNNIGCLENVNLSLDILTTSKQTHETILTHVLKLIGTTIALFNKDVDETSGVIIVGGWPLELAKTVYRPPALLFNTNMLTNAGDTSENINI